MNGQRWFQRKEDYAPRQTPAASPFRKFEVKCAQCGSFQLRLVTQLAEDAGDLSVVLLCTRCRQKEILPAR